MITVNKANPTPGEITSSLTGSTGDGAGLHFDGAAGNIDIASPPDLGTAFSFEFVIKADEWGSNAGYFLDFSNGGRFIFGTTSSQSYNISIYDNSAWGNFGVKVLDDLKVHHLVVTVDGTAATLYDNGNQVGTLTISGSHGIDSCSDLVIGPGATGTPMTFYRTRFYNHALSSAEVQTAYERADVPYLEQYGSQTNKISAAVDKNWGTNQADTGNDTNDRATFNGNYVWNTSGSMTNISVASNVLQFTATTGAGMYYPTTLNAGEKYRVTLATGTISGTFAVRTYNGSSYDNHGTLSASTTNSIEFTAPASTENYLYIQATSAGTIQINAASVSNEIVRVGCVSDYQTQWANPSQSLIVQDASGAADGTCSASGVTQVQPVVQLNAERILVNGTVPRVGIGLPVADTPGGLLSIDATNSNTPKILFENQAGETADAAITTIDDTGGTDICIGSNVYINSSGFLTRFNTAEESSYVYVSKTGNLYFGTGDTSATASNRVQIDKSGNVGLSVSPETDWDGGVAMQVGDGVALFSPTGTDELDLTANAYYDGSDWKRISNNHTSRYEHTNGSHIFSSAGADVADSTITWNTALTIDSSGNVDFTKLVTITDSDGRSSVKLVGAKTSDGNFGDITARNNGTSGQAQISFRRDGADDATAILFYTNTGGASETEKMRISSTGNVQVGAASTAVSSGKLMSYFDGTAANGLQLHDTTTGTTTDNAVVFSRNTSTVGKITTTNSSTAYVTSSDYRLKENLEPLNGALDRLDQLPVYRFNFKADPDTTVDGFVAHEVSAHVPEAVTGEKDGMRTVVVQEAIEAVEAQPATYWEEGDELPEGVAVGDEKTAAVEAVEAVEEVTEEQPDYQGIDQSKLVPLLVAAVKELKAKVETLENA